MGAVCALAIATAAAAQEDEAPAEGDASSAAEDVIEDAGDDFDFDTAEQYEEELPLDAEPLPDEPGPEGQLVDDDSIEEVRVRGTKRQGNLQETPLAVSTFDMQQLDTANIQTFEDLAPSIPNFQYNEVIGAASFTIRGIQSLGGSSATAFHIDGIYQENPYTASGIAFFDLEGVEVLRGPTGTEYGRNANAGALNVLTNPPSFDFEAFGDIQVGSYHERRIRGVLNVPIVDDKIAIRASGIVNRRYGFMENLASDVRSGDLDDDRTMAIRGQVRVQPNDNIDWITRATYVRDRSNGIGLKINGEYPQGVPLLTNPVDGEPINVFIYNNAPQPNPTDPRQIYLDSPTQNDRNFIMVNSTFVAALDDLPGTENAQFTIFGGYQYSDQAGQGDLDFSNAPSIGSPVLGEPPGPFPLIATDIKGDRSEWVAEASFEAESPLPIDGMSLEWLVGAFYFGSQNDVTTDTNTAFQLSTDEAANGLLFFVAAGDADEGYPAAASRSASRNHSAALFGNARWNLWDDVTIFGGLRYSHDWSSRSLVTTGSDAYFPSNILPPSCVGIPIDDGGDGDWGSFIGRLGAEWRYTDENMAYVSYHSGFKPGTVELLRGAPGCEVVPQPDTKPERINAFEIGSRNRFLDDKLQANLTGFAYLWDDIQVSTLVGTALVTQNANSAVATGFEFEAVFTPLADLDIPDLSIDTFLMTFNFGLTWSEFTDFENGCLVEEPDTCNPFSPDFDPQDWTGNELPRAPLYTFTITAAYEQTLGRYGSIMPFVRYFYSDDSFFRAVNDPATDLQPAYGLLDFTLTWRSNDRRLSLEGFVNNVTDQDVIAQKTLSSYLVGNPILDSFQAPRTWGVRLGLNW